MIDDQNVLLRSSVQDAAESHLVILNHAFAEPDQFHSYADDGIGEQAAVIHT